MKVLKQLKYVSKLIYSLISERYGFLVELVEIFVVDTGVLKLSDISFLYILDLVSLIINSLSDFSTLL